MQRKTTNATRLPFVPLLFRMMKKLVVKTTKKGIQIALPLFLIIALSGCTGFSVHVDSLASPNAPIKKKYLLMPGNEGVTWDDLQFQEYALYLIRALESKGYVSTPSIEEADVAIMLSYGIGDPQEHQHSFSVPTYGQTGISSSTTRGTASTYGNITSLNAYTSYTPSYGVTGYKTYSRTRTTYFRYALITGYDLEEYKKTEKPVQLWQTTVTSRGTSGDLRRVFPVLIAASIPYLASDSGKKVKVLMLETEDAVKVVKGEISE